MRALVKANPRAGLWLQDVPIPQVRDDEVLIKIRKTGICGTDLHIWNWDEWAQKTVPVPLVTGHEYAGEVVEVGRNVTQISIGQRVSGEGHLVDLGCTAARAGNFHLDPHSLSVGVNHPGAFAEYLALPAFNVIALPDEIDDELGAILDPLGNAVHVAQSFDLVGNDVLIMGAGPIGIMAAAVARFVGAHRIFIADINAERLALANRIVDAITLDPDNTSLTEVAQRYGLSDGFPIGFEMSGSNEALESLIGAMTSGGQIACLGLPTRKVTLDWNTVVCKSLRIKGVYGREMFETWRKTLNMLQSGLNVRDIITHRLPVDDFHAGFQAMQAGTAGKVILNWST
ncbi:L-threonine 3-dehydrogenase [Sodalis sp. RH19]|uniref:L-threonine 3-dehydrogenase n=1 Tax=Sodalis sp. RH19 TaxID=3394334 RepID=UPI0039B6CAA1